MNCNIEKCKSCKICGFVFWLTIAVVYLVVCLLCNLGLKNL